MAKREAKAPPATAERIAELEAVLLAVWNHLHWSADSGESRAAMATQVAAVLGMHDGA